jgi:hypothetical protein
MAATARRCFSAGATAKLNPTQSTVTTTNIVANENCAHRRLGVSIERSLARGLAMPTSIPRRREEGKGWPCCWPGKAVEWYNAAMASPRFQFRLWTIFALTAFVGWWVVAVPYWTRRHPNELWLRAPQDRSFELRRDRSGAMILSAGLTSAGALATGLAWYRYSKRR